MPTARRSVKTNRVARLSRISLSRFRRVLSPLRAHTSMPPPKVTASANSTGSRIMRRASFCPRILYPTQSIPMGRLTSSRITRFHVILPSTAMIRQPETTIIRFALIRTDELPHSSPRNLPTYQAGKVRCEVNCRQAVTRSLLRLHQRRVGNSSDGSQARFR